MAREKGNREYTSEVSAGNRLGKAAQTLLDLGGPRLFPPEADLSHVRFIYDVGQGGYSREEMLTFETEAIALNGTTGQTVSVIAPLNTFDAGKTRISNFRQRLDDSKGALVGAPLAWNSRVHALRLNLQFDAAGAVAYAGTRVGIILSINQQTILGTLPANIPVYEGRDLILTSAGVLAYPWNVNGMTGLLANYPQGIPSSLWTRWVPPRAAFNVALIGAAAFPANTTFTVTGMVNQVPEGANLPL